MRKIVVSMNVTLDGFMAGPNCELDWHFQNWSADMAHSACEQLSQADTIVLGRITYDAMARYWPARSIDLTFAREDIDFAEMMNNYTKIVFSKTLKALSWNNSKLATGDLRDEINALKKQAGKDVIIYGSGKLVSSLIALRLVDEYQIWIHPILLGKGKPLFKSLTDNLNLKLSRSKTFHSGVVMLDYECK
jgi:dihydrofolate reductase